MLISDPDNTIAISAYNRRLEQVKLFTQILRDQIESYQAEEAKLNELISKLSARRTSSD